MTEADYISAFKSNDNLQKVASRLKVGPNRLRQAWVRLFGAEAVTKRGLHFRNGASSESFSLAKGAFDTDEPFKQVAKRLGMSPNTPRALWTSEFGAEAFSERGSRIQQLGATRHGSRTSGKVKRRTLESYPCRRCGTTLELSRGQAAKLKVILCSDCCGKTVQCPVCRESFTSRGLQGHLYRSKDPPHQSYIIRIEDERWASQVEGQDYVRCAVCGFRGVSLNLHLKTHGLTDFEYRSRFGAPIRSEVNIQNHREGLLRAMSGRAYGWTRDELTSFADEKGQILVAKAARALQASPLTVLWYCRRMGLPTRNKLAWQRMVLDHASEVWGSPYDWEWSSSDIINPETGRPFRYDGLFPDLRVIVEVNVDQHYRYSEAWHLTPENFEKLRLRDELKAKLAMEAGYRLIVVRPPDPVHESSYWVRALGEGSSETDQTSRVVAIADRLRQDGFPVIEPSVQKTRTALTKLNSVTLRLDDAWLRPYSTVGTTACSEYFPNRYRARHHATKLSAFEAWFDTDALQKAVRLQLDSGHPVTSSRVLRAVVMYQRTPSVFRPVVARYIYQTYAYGKVVWDPCSGFGGRLMGACSAGVSTYIGTDIEPETVSGNERLANALGFEDQCRLVVSEAETFDPGPVDLVFTSPPYFNLEEYGTFSAADMAKYSSPQSWFHGFLAPVVQTSFHRLSSGGHLILNLPCKPVQGSRLDLLASEYAKELGLVKERILWMPLRSRKGPLKGEPLLVWRKN